MTLEPALLTLGLDLIIFMSDTMIPVSKACIAKKVPVCFNMPSKMYKDLARAIGTCKTIVKFAAGNTIYCWF